MSSKESQLTEFLEKEHVFSFEDGWGHIDRDENDCLVSATPSEDDVEIAASCIFWKIMDSEEVGDKWIQDTDFDEKGAVECEIIDYWSDKLRYSKGVVQNFDIECKKTLPVETVGKEIKEMIGLLMKQTREQTKKVAERVMTREEMEFMENDKKIKLNEERAEAISHLSDLEYDEYYKTKWTLKDDILNDIQRQDPYVWNFYSYGDDFSQSWKHIGAFEGCDLAVHLKYDDEKIPRIESGCPVIKNFKKEKKAIKWEAEAAERILESTNGKCVLEIGLVEKFKMGRKKEYTIMTGIQCKEDISDIVNKGTKEINAQVPQKVVDQLEMMLKVKEIVKEE